MKHLERKLKKLESANHFADRDLRDMTDEELIRQLRDGLATLPAEALDTPYCLFMFKKVANCGCGHCYKATIDLPAWFVHEIEAKWLPF